MKKLLLLYALVILVAATSFAQITADKAIYTTQTNYSGGATPQDNIYVFDNSENNVVGVGELTATPSDGTNGWDFKWTKWDIATQTFSIDVKTTTNASESTVSNCNDGLYRVEITKGTETETYQAWVINDKAKKMKFYHIESNCAGVSLGIEFHNSLTYIDITNSNEKPVPMANNGLTFIFSRDGKEAGKQQDVINDETVKNFMDTEAYEGEATYNLTIIDQYNCTYKANSVNATTKVVKADFSVTPEEGEAPLEVTFTNNSINADTYEWYLYEDEKRIDNNAVSVTDSLVNNEIVTGFPVDKFTYEISGEYKIKLIAKNSVTGCKDVLFTDKVMITVIPSLVEVPNVFVVNGANSTFKAKTNSVKSFQGTILNRWGRVLFEWKDPKKGWDGKNKGKLVKSGTYFYVITAVGLDDPSKSYTKKGSFMLLKK